MKHRAAFIGAGDVVRRSYLPAISQQSDCKVVAICSQSGQSAKELADLYGIKIVSQHYEEVLQQPDIDTVFICTPTHVHREIAEAAMRYGRHVLVEKPLCTTYQDSRMLLQQARSYDKTFYAAFNNQFRVENRWLKTKVLTGKIGEVELIDFEWYRTKRHVDKAWLYDPPRSGGGVLVDLGAHMLHLALSLLPNRQYYTASCHNVSHQAFSSSVEDTSISMISVDDKTTILIKLGWDMKLPKPSRVTLELFGLAGRISNRDFEEAKVGSPVTKSDGYDLMIAEFLQHIDTNTKPNLDLVDDTMMLVDALYRSSQTQTTIAGEFCGAVNKN